MSAENIKVPFNKPCLTGKELEYVADSVKSGSLVGNGEYTRKCEALLENAFGAKKVLLTGSCTDALEMASLLIGLEPGNREVIPSWLLMRRGPLGLRVHIMRCRMGRLDWGDTV